MKTLLVVAVMLLSLTGCDNRSCAEKGGQPTQYWVAGIDVPDTWTPASPGYYVGKTYIPGTPSRFVPGVHIPGHMAEGCTK